MDIKDFQDNLVYKLYLPVIYIFNWFLMLAGPFYFPAFYERYCLYTIAYLALRSSLTFLYTFIGSLKTAALLRTFAAAREGKGESDSNNGKEIKSTLEMGLIKDEFYYCFIIPNYKEDREVLEGTLDHIAAHPNALQKYLVFLAIEDHEVGGQAKAKELINAYAGKFKLMGFTVHKLRQHEQRGKAANVSWCAQHLKEDYFKSEGIDEASVMLTIIDADSWVPQQYIERVEQHLSANYAKRNQFIYQPCQMFTRNHMEVPNFTRTYDSSHGLVHFSNLHSLFATSFPLSNYSLPYALAAKIGFWDTHPDAIGEDFHTTIKAFWKTHGQVRTVSVFTPFNQLNIQSGQGYWSDVGKRFWQAERHGRGCADAAYCLKKVKEVGLCWRTFLIVYQVLEITTLPAVVPWCMISSTLANLYRSLGGTGLPPPTLDFSWLYQICTLSFVLSYFCYSYVSNWASQLYYGIDTGNWLHKVVRAIEYIAFFPVNLFAITIPSATIAAFRVTFGNNVYNTAEKHITPLKKTRGE